MSNHALNGDDGAYMPEEYSNHANTVNGLHSLQARALHQNEKLSVIQFGLVKVNSKSI
jgi:hypothetical protein